ncbi:unnamed protein product (macronuclear) [Paramecium tetraurelia]|uniref:Uncharacterized protein n=1 Tax=Paramecium tetraurelia TaxID=5888 RepID=A0D618_PARTE|nr:uncharacterized protein GSPATT00013915001 [Paramecium tetraurelia]CAK78485.1 unnamed protein product [Paramecium tetraurelia]|eukprot:XP_001445882.1 hypothetical protein (macronuclear) [Paramecium tetraurelia strain d4-2]
MSNLYANEQQSLREQIFKIKDKLLSLSQNLNNYHADNSESNSTAHFKTQEDEQSPQQTYHQNEEKSFSQLNFIDKTKLVPQNQCHQFKKLKPLFNVPDKSLGIDKSPFKRVNSTGRPPQILRQSSKREASISYISPQQMNFSQRISLSPTKRL